MSQSMILIRYTDWKDTDHDVRIRHVTLDKKNRAPAVHFNRMEYPDGVRDWTSIGETEYYDHTAGNVLTGFTSLIVNGREFSGKYIEEHMAEVQMLLDGIYTEEKLRELTGE